MKLQHASNRGAPERDISSLRAFGPGGSRVLRVVRVSARALLWGSPVATGGVGWWWWALVGGHRPSPCMVVGPWGPGGMRLDGVGGGMAGNDDSSTRVIQRSPAESMIRSLDDKSSTRAGPSPPHPDVKSSIAPDDKSSTRQQK